MHKLKYKIHIHFSFFLTMIYMNNFSLFSGIYAFKYLRLLLGQGADRQLKNSKMKTAEAYIYKERSFRSILIISKMSKTWLKC